MKSYRLRINSVDHTVTVPDDERLLWMLRDDLGMTGTKPGCDGDVCGCCMVLLDGQPTLACQTTVAAVAGRAITTIEGIAATAHDGTIMLHPVQQAFLDAQASQCGWCLGAQVLSTIALLNDNPTPSETAINQAMDRVYCRCAVYGRIRVAIRRAAESASGSSAGGAAV